MKRHLRIVIDASTITGHSLRNSDWFPSRTFERETLASFKSSYPDQIAFGDRVTAMLGFKWMPWHSSFTHGCPMMPDLRVYALTASPRWEWLNKNASGLWLPCTTTYRDGLGYWRQDVQIWFENLTDATLFAVAYP